MDLKALRKERGLRQIDLAKMADISITWVWVLENGFHNRVSKKIKGRIARVLRCSTKEIFGS